MSGFNRTSILTMIACLQNGAYSGAELAKECKLSVSTVRLWLKAMHAMKMIHICAWDRTRLNNPSIRVYHWGEGRDRRKPPKLSQAQRQAKLRAKKHMAILHNLTMPPARKVQ